MYIYKAVGATSSEGFPVRRMIGAGAVSHRRGAVIAVCRGPRPRLPAAAVVPVTPTSDGDESGADSSSADQRPIRRAPRSSRIENICPPPVRDICHPDTCSKILLSRLSAQRT